MPRESNGSPQDSIESILLAISRRDTINPETLVHYYARLDEEWTHGALELVLRLLSSNDVSAQNASLHILAELATEDDLDDLEEFVADPTVGDVAKLSLAPVLKGLGSEMVEDGFLEYLNDPPNAIQQMQLRVLDVVDRGEMGVDAILQDVLSTPIEQRLAFIQWLGGSNDPRAAQLLLPIIEGQSGKVALEAINALEQLGTIANPQTIPALNYILATATNRQLKQSVRAALGRLTMQSTPGMVDAALTQQALSPHEARVSFVDGSGGQLLTLSWLRPDGLLKIVNVFLGEKEGVRECYGMVESTIEHWNELIAALAKQSFGCFLVPFSYSLTMIAEAVTTTRRLRRKLPIAYFIWRPMLDPKTLEENAAPVVTALPPQPLNEEARILAENGEELYALFEFTSWLYQKPTDLAPFLQKIWKDGQTPIGVAPKNGKNGKSSKGGKKAKNMNQQILAVLDEAMTLTMDDTWRLFYEKLLRRQALLLHLTHREQESHRALAVAAMLHPSSGVPIQKQSFPRFMMHLSLNQGGVDVLADIIEEGNIDETAPIMIEWDEE